MSIIKKQVKASLIMSIMQEAVEAIERKDARSVTLEWKGKLPMMVTVCGIKGNVVQYIGSK